MRPGARHWLFWSPRALCILFAVFISMFALDVFGEGQGFWQTTIALLFHLIPTALIVVALALAWRWEWLGAVLFFLLALGYVAMVGLCRPWSWYAFISGPLLLVAVLFLLNWIYRKELRRTE